MPHPPSYVRLLTLALMAAACTGRNYPAAGEPRYEGRASRTAPAGDTLRVVSFNVEFSKEIPRAIRILKTHPELRDAHILLLQEMTAPAARAIADSLGMSHVYYPAIYNRLARRDFGNAVASRFPIEADAKLILPGFSRYARTQRIATAATIRVGAEVVRVYSTHLGTPADLGWMGRVAQLAHIMDDARPFDRVIIGGDMNSGEVGRVARDSGYVWPTDTIPESNTFGRLDHIFVKGVAVTDSAGAGTVHIPPGVSDHRPIWVRVTVR